MFSLKNKKKQGVTKVSFPLTTFLGFVSSSAEIAVEMASKQVVEILGNPSQDVPLHQIHNISLVPWSYL